MNYRTMNFCPNCASPMIVKSIDNFDRFVCEDSTCGYIHWNNPIAVVVVLVQLGDEFILARNAEWPDKIFSLISGYVDANETLEQTAIREVHEELGLTAWVKSYVGSYPYQQKNQIVVAYWLSASGEIKLNHEIAEVKLLSLQELLQYDFGKLEITVNVLKDWKVLAGH